MTKRGATLFYDAAFHTGRTESETFKYMLVSGGRIVRLSNERPSESEYSRSVSLNAKHAYPCLTDAHLHLLESVALAASGLDVCEIRDGGVVPDDLEGVEKRLKSFCAGLKSKAPLVANGYVISAIKERRLPTCFELDEWTGGREAIIYSIDGHASAMSSAMMSKLCIKSENGDGAFFGEAHERIQGRVLGAIASSITPSVLAKGIANFENACAGYGIARVVALEGNGDAKNDITAKLIVSLARRMKIGVRFYFQYIDIDKAKKLSKYQKRPRIGGCGDWEMDGAVGAHTAAFYSPYKDTGKTAKVYYSQVFIEEKVRRADAEGFAISAHAIGESAIDLILSALEKTKSGTLHRVDHFEFPSDNAVRLIKEGRFAVTMQPGFSWIDKRYLKSYEQYLPPEKVRQQRLKSLVDAGVCICGSSDSPVQEIDPFLQMQGMTEFYVEEESITPYQAFRSYTLNPAISLGEQDEFGTLEAGKAADFFTSDDDFFELAPKRISAFKVSETFFSGEKYRPKKGTVAELLKMYLKKPKKV